MDSSYEALITLISLVLLSLCYLLWSPSNKSKTKPAPPPEPAGGRPLMGHLHMLQTGEQPQKILSQLAEQYGPIFTIRLGLNRALVVSSSDLAKECFTTHDKIFPSRPTSVGTRLMSYNFTMLGFVPYGSYWREIRKIMMTELLSNRRLESLKNVWTSEIRLSIGELFQDWKTSTKTQVRSSSSSSSSSSVRVYVVDLKQWFGNLAFNIASNMVVGKRVSRANNNLNNVDEEESSRRFQHGFREFFRLLGGFLLEDALPFLRWWDTQGYQREMRDTAREMDDLIQRLLEEHKRRRTRGGEVKGAKDFMDVMLNILGDSKVAGADVDTVNKSTCLTLILGATDTTMVTLTWTLTLLLNNRHVLKKAQEELDTHVGKDRVVEISDLQNLTYIQAILKEVFRLYPPAPLLGIREALEDCEVAGYHVRKGTHLMVNVWKIHRDPATWSDPTEFKPERFLTTHRHVELWGQDFELIPFGSGRRACPGISLALQVLPLALARFLQGFEVGTVEDAKVDATESRGITTAKDTPLEAVITPRLDEKFY